MKCSPYKTACLTALQVMAGCWIFMRTITLAAADVGPAFDAANKLYEQGKFNEAVAAYEQLLHDNGASPALHFNLGNAHFKSGNTGMAIWHYRIAERMTPRDPDVQANLRFARDHAGGTGTGNWRSALISRLTINEWSALACVSLWIWLGFLGCRLARPAMRSSLRAATRWAALCFLINGACLSSAAYERFIRKEAVVIATEAVVRFGPLEESESHFALRSGAELRLTDSKDGWWQVLDAQGRSGWVKSSQVMPLP